MKRIAVGLTLLSLTAFAAPQPLPNTHWELVNVKQTGVSTLAPGGTSRPTLSFERDAPRVSGFGGCNGYSGAYTAQNKRLKIENVISTKKACPVLEVENKFFNVLSNASTYVVTPNSLLISSAKGDSLLFTRTRMK
jgi:heat shock protein HslJ